MSHLEETLKQRRYQMTYPQHVDPTQVLDHLAVLHKDMLQKKTRDVQSYRFFPQSFPPYRSVVDDLNFVNLREYVPTTHLKGVNVLNVRTFEGKKKRTIQQFFLLYLYPEVEENDLESILPQHYSEDTLYRTRN